MVNKNKGRERERGRRRRKDVNDDDGDDDDKNVDEQNDANFVHCRMGTARSITYHQHNCQRKSFHFRGEGQVQCARSYS